MDAVIPKSTEMDSFLARALRGDLAGWPADWDNDGIREAVLGRVAYHGIAGLLSGANRPINDWPAPLYEKIRGYVLAQSMWELRHKAVLGELLQSLAADGISALLLKGTAVAYDVYDNPAVRERGDTDLLVEKDSREAARRVLAARGFARENPELPDALRSQEIWVIRSDDGTSHSIDLHWQPLNAPALDRHLSFEEMAGEARPLPRLSEAARAPSRPMMLFHACLHRALHDCAPYFVGSKTYFGGNRLIWLYDLALLGKALSDAEWRAFCRMAAGKRVASVCLEGLSQAESSLGSFCPAFVRDDLRNADSGSYFRSGQFGRALQDVFAVPGLQRKWQYFWARSMPTAEFMRGKYPEMANRPLPALYVRRLVELVRERPGRDV